MDSDRELLALAARAAGLDIVWNPPEHPVAGWHCATGESWDALLDDGDALRLAVRLSIPIFPYDDETSTGTTGVVAKNWGSKEANTRRAIVRSAAELGRRG